MNKNRPRGLSSSAEDYIEAILELTESDGVVRVTDVANKLGIAKPSVTQAISALKERGLVTQERYGHVFLTSEGLIEAKRVRRRHLILRTFLKDILGVDGEQSEIDACQIEHVVSSETVERIVAFIEGNLLTPGSTKDVAKIL